MPCTQIWSSLCIHFGGNSLNQLILVSPEDWMNLWSDDLISSTWFCWRHAYTDMTLLTGHFWWHEKILLFLPRRQCHNIFSLLLIQGPVSLVISSCCYLLTWMNRCHFLKIKIKTRSKFLRPLCKMKGPISLPYLTYFFILHCKFHFIRLVSSYFSSAHQTFAQDLDGEGLISTFWSVQKIMHWRKLTI